MISRTRLLSGAALAVCAAGLFSRLAARSQQQPVFSGTIEAQAVPVFGITGGKISHVFVKQGDRVNKDQILLTFEDLGLDRHLARAKSALQEAPPQFVETATSMFERIPPALAARLLRSDPAVLNSEREYTEALAAFEGDPSAESRRRLQRAGIQRARAHQSAAAWRPERLSALHSLQREGAETLNWLEQQKARFEVRAPVSGTLELFDLQPGTVLAPLSPVAIIDAQDHFVVQAPVTGNGIAVGGPIEVVLQSGDQAHATIASVTEGRLQAIVLKAGIRPVPGASVEVFLRPYEH